MNEIYLKRKYSLFNKEYALEIYFYINDWLDLTHVYLSAYTLN